jgi:hypothetical protein
MLPCGKTALTFATHDISPDFTHLQYKLVEAIKKMQPDEKEYM